MVYKDDEGGSSQQQVDEADEEDPNSYLNLIDFDANENEYVDERVEVVKEVVEEIIGMVVESEKVVDASMWKKRFRLRWKS